MRFLFDRGFFTGGLQFMQRRHLFDFPSSRPEIAIVNNSGLLFCLFALKMHRSAAHNHLTVFVPRFWMDNSHQNYDNLSWGQALNGLPRYIQQEFLKIYPNQPDHQPITWKQYKELLEFVKGELRNRGISIFSGTPTITRHPDHYQMEIAGQCLIKPLNTFFYNSFRTPKVRHHIQGFPERSHTDLYSMARSQVPLNIIIAGGGRSVIWLANHFPEKNFACIKHKESEYPLLRHQAMPANIATYDLEDFAETKRFRAFSRKDGEKHLSMILDTKNQGRSFHGEFFAAIGLEPSKAVTEAIHETNLLVYPYSASLDWVSPEEIPIGSLMEATLRWAYATDNLNLTFQTNCFHEAYFSEMITRFLKSKDIFVDSEFFTTLKKDIIQSYKMKPSSPFLHLPDNNDTLEIYRACYKRTYNNAEKADELAEALKLNINEMYAMYDSKSNLTMAL